MIVLLLLLMLLMRPFVIAISDTVVVIRIGRLLVELPIGRLIASRIGRVVIIVVVVIIAANSVATAVYIVVSVAATRVCSVVMKRVHGIAVLVEKVVRHTRIVVGAAVGQAVFRLLLTQRRLVLQTIK